VATTIDTSSETHAAPATPRRAEAPPGSKVAVEQLVKSLAAVTAVFYVVGFLTTNAYLYKLGVSDFSLLRTRFVLTGVLTMIPLVLALMGGIYAAVDTAAFGGLGRNMSRASLWTLADITVPFLLYFLLFWYVADNDPVTAARDAAILSVICAVMVAAFLAALALFRRSGRRPVSHLIYRRKSVSYERFTGWFGIPDGVVECLVFAVAGPLLLVAYIGVFGDHFYPMIPEQIGGGRPRVVQLLVASDAVPAVRELGLDVSAESPLSPPVELLWEGEQSMIVRLPPPRERTVVQLSRGLVDGIAAGAVVALPEPAASESVST
jgi:hypothetical protein